MKILSILRLATLSLLMIFMQQVHCARNVGAQSPAEAAVQKIVNTAAVAVEQEKGELAIAFVESNLIIKKSTEIMDNARELLLNKDTTQLEDLQNIKTIIEHNKAIVMAQQKLEKMRDEIAKKVEKDIAPEGYWGKFVAGAKNFGSGIASFFTPGIGTEEEKATARLMIKGLTDQEVKITEKYALLQKDLTAAEKVQLKSRYDLIVAYIEAAIYEQQIITGDTKSSMIKRGLLLGAAAAGTVATGALLKSKYFGEEEAAGEEPEEEKPTGEKPEEKKPEAEVVVPKAEKTASDMRPTDLDKLRKENVEAVKKHAIEESTPYQVGKWLKDVPGKVYGAAQSVVGTVSEAFKNRGETPENPEEQGITELARELSKGLEGVKETSKDIAEAAREAYESIEERRPGTTVPTLSDIEKAASEMRPGVQKYLQEAHESIEERRPETTVPTLSDIGKAASEMRPGVQKYLQEAYESVKEKIPSASQVWQTAKGLTNTAENKLRGYLPNADLEKEGSEGQKPNEEELDLEGLGLSEEEGVEQQNE
jgi:hypothetical protein